MATKNETTLKGPITPSIIQENLDEMIPYINKLLQELPIEKKIYYTINDDFPNGDFVLQEDGEFIQVIDNYLLSMVRNIFHKAYLEAKTASATKWHWKIVDINSDVTIPNLISELATQRIACNASYQTDKVQQKTFTYDLSFKIFVHAAVEESTPKDASSTNKFYFKVEGK